MANDFAPDNDIVDILCAGNDPPDWLIPDLMILGTMVTIVGESGAGKSYISYTLGLALAAGIAALSGIIPKGEPRRVIYFDEENSEADRAKYLQRSWVGLTQQNKVDPFGEHLERLQENFWPVQFHLGNEDWVDRAAEWIDFVRPHLVIYDTATPAFNIEDENSNSEGSQAIKEVKKLIRLVEPMHTAIVLKHAKTRTEKGQIRTVRGAKVWKDQSDQMLFQVKAAGRPRKDGLSLTRLVPDKIRAYGLRQPIYISPQWTDDERSGLTLTGSYQASKDHRVAESEDEE